MAKSDSEHDEDEEGRQRIADRVLGKLEDAVYWGIALVLIIGSVSLLIAQFNTMLRLRDAAAKTVMLEILDGLLLIFIFVELLYAVRACLRSHEIVAEPFLIVGILAGIKEIVVLSVEAATLLEKGPAFSRAAGIPRTREKRQATKRNQPIPDVTTCRKHPLATARYVCHHI